MQKNFKLVPVTTVRTYQELSLGQTLFSKFLEIFMFRINFQKKGLWRYFACFNLVIHITQKKVPNLTLSARFEPNHGLKQSSPVLRRIISTLKILLCWTYCMCHIYYIFTPVICSIAWKMELIISKIKSKTEPS